MTQSVSKKTSGLIGIAVLLLAALVWPRAYGPSLMVTPFLMGVITVSLIGLVCRPSLPKWPGIWLLASFVAIMLGPQSEPLSLIALLAAALCAWISIGLGAQFVARRSLLRGVMWTLLIGMVIHALVAWLQYFDIERIFYPLVSQNESDRPYGNLRQANHLASFCVLGLVSLWWLYREREVTLRVSLGVAFLAFSGLALSASRTGLLELFLISGCLCIWRKTARPHEFKLFFLAPLWVLLLTQLLDALSALFGFGLEGVHGRGMESVSIRFIYWQEAWSLALMHPIAGVGWGNLGFARLFELPFNPAGSNTTNAHNLVLHLLAETGFATTFLILAPMVWFLCRRLPWRLADTNSQWAWMLIAVVGVHSLLEYPAWYMHFLLPTAFAFGVLMVAEPVAARANRTFPSAGTVVLAALLLVSSFLALADYVRVARAFGEDGRASTDMTRVTGAQGTVLFRYYADRALVERVALSSANASAMLEVTDRLLNVGPNPIVFWVRLEALCRLGRALQAGETAVSFAQIFPAAHDEFMQINSPEVLNACGLLSSKDTKTP
ncbi:PglL family O-oligosaccharyltransferase [Hydrogenophaga palleronii]|uniref:PglL family O-oligosaccharyltransferase n=1 Tax=Hydrogenophaga palleronii TaxID=65655 RepID=UPI0008260971|nr:O-antigen ligase family protein [Hydrogenophaga palleronii]